ncbi:hypothetical protein ATANTOWER_003363 [Ataeniobius toweri]|uniref:Secreted protein n=1 Tax=Ataeniobius toweri TaxID=208326 RepID=A0ABU7CEB9_9TELE|nr:hypothetical protein [Ataeniobius toweri]
MMQRQLHLTPVQVLVPVRVQCWAWHWHCAVTIAVSGVTTWVSTSSSREDLELLSSPPSVGCPAGLRVGSDWPIRAAHHMIPPIREERKKTMKQQRRQKQ